MKKILIISGLLAFLFFELHSQTTVTTQNFDGTVNWTVSPTGSWISNSVYYVSSPKSYHGYVPNQLKDSIVLTTPFYDCSA